MVELIDAGRNTIQKTFGRSADSLGAVLAGKTLGSEFLSVYLGEETGDLDKMLIKVADNYDEEVETLVASLVSLRMRRALRRRSTSFKRFSSSAILARMPRIRSTIKAGSAQAQLNGTALLISWFSPWLSVRESGR